MDKYQTLHVVTEDAVARVELDRPNKGNSLNAMMWHELKDVFEMLDDQSDIRAIVLGGRGKHFSTGIDLDFLLSMQQDLQKMTEGCKQEHLLRFIADLQDSVSAIERCRKPVLAAVQGFCLGAGVDIVAACDMRYATSATRFCVKEVDLAIVADLGSLQRLPGIVGQGVARELAFSGRVFKGEEALTMGFVNRLFPRVEELSIGVLALAAELATKSPLTLRGIKETLNYSRDHTVSEGLIYVAQRNAAMLLSKDLDEALSAYMEKRQPRFEDYPISISK
jgi:enoyl-CoA hydratase/carnithine racemase